MDTAMRLEEFEVKKTIEDIYNLPEGQRAELIDGRLYMMATPNRIHQRLVMVLSNSIFNYIQSKNGNCEVYPAPFAVFLNADDKIYLEPDISVICDENKLTDEGCKGAPDWIIEVVSPSSRSRDYIKKMLKYSTSGVREYWIVDYEKNLVIVYNFENDLVGSYTFSDKIRTGIYKDFEMDLSEIELRQV